MDFILQLPNNKYKNSLLGLSQKIDKTTIAIAESKKRKAYINLSNKGQDKMIVENDNFIVPYFNFQNQDRLLIIMNGYSRSGKSVFVSKYVLTNYIQQQNRNVFYICPTHHKHDKSLQEFDMKYIDPKTITEDLILRAQDYFKNSLVIVDDIDSVNNKSLWSLFAFLVNVGGKFKINIVFITHANTVVIPSIKLNLVTDCDAYITYNTVNNRFFKEYNKDAPIKDFEKDVIVSCFPKIKVIMSNSRIIKY
jgi:hypothetical protein